MFAIMAKPKADVVIIRTQCGRDNGDRRGYLVRLPSRHPQAYD